LPGFFALYIQEHPGADVIRIDWLRDTFSNNDALGLLLVEGPRIIRGIRQDVWPRLGECHHERSCAGRAVRVCWSPCRIGVRGGNVAASADFDFDGVSQGFIDVSRRIRSGMTTAPTRCIMLRRSCVFPGVGGSFRGSGLIDVAFACPDVTVAEVHAGGLLAILVFRFSLLSRLSA